MCLPWFRRAAAASLPAAVAGSSSAWIEQSARRCRLCTRLSHIPLQTLVHQLVGGITRPGAAQKCVRLGKELRIGADSSGSFSHCHWSRDFLAPLGDSLARDAGAARRPIAPPDAWTSSQRARADAAARSSKQQRRYVSCPTAGALLRSVCRDREVAMSVDARDDVSGLGCTRSGAQAARQPAALGEVCALSPTARREAPCHRSR
jgi:hypothetical protein